MHRENVHTDLVILMRIVTKVRYGGKKRKRYRKFNASTEEFPYLLAETCIHTLSGLSFATEISCKFHVSFEKYLMVQNQYNNGIYPFSGTHVCKQKIGTNDNACVSNMFRSLNSSPSNTCRGSFASLSSCEHLDDFSYVSRVQ